MPTSSVPAAGITPQQFIAKWSRSELSERAASQEHFIDLCRLLGQPTPAEHDATGAEYTFEKGVAVTSGASREGEGERGFADVWWRGKFGWEYKRKGKHPTLEDARAARGPRGPLNYLDTCGERTTVLSFCQ